MKGYTSAALDQFLGKEIGTSDWTLIDQARIDEFASCTGDHFWYHTDAERARRESPFGTTIAHGYLTLSLLATMGQEIGMLPADAVGGLNYGLNRVRFMTPVKEGSRVRLKLSLTDLEAKPDGFLLSMKNVMEIKGYATPALVAETLVLAFLKPPVQLSSSDSSLLKASPRK